MRLSIKHQDMNHKKSQKIKKPQKIQYKLDELLENPKDKESEYQLEERFSKERNKYK